MKQAKSITARLDDKLLGLLDELAIYYRVPRAHAIRLAIMDAHRMYLGSGKSKPGQEARGESKKV